MVKAVLFDVDGTLVDSNDAHAHAWVKAFANAGVRVGFDRVRCAIGMGADKLIPAVSGIEEDTPLGQRITQQRSEIFKSEYLPHLQPFRDAGRLVHAIESLGMKAVAATSAKRDELEALLKIADAASLLDDSASGDDADQSKPAPDIVHAALKRAGADSFDAVMIGDTPYDVEAASRARVKAVAFRCDGWSHTALRGAIAIYDGPSELFERLAESPLVSPKSQVTNPKS